MSGQAAPCHFVPGQSVPTSISGIDAWQIVSAAPNVIPVPERIDLDRRDARDCLLMP